MARSLQNKMTGFNPGDDAHTAYRNGLTAAANAIKDVDSRNSILDLVHDHLKAPKNKSRSAAVMKKSTKKTSK